MKRPLGSALILAGAAFASLGLAGCGEREQTAHYEEGRYRGKPDTPVDSEVATMVLAGGVAVILLLAAIVALRVARIRRLFDEGREIEASVRKVTHARGRTRLKLEFELHGIPYKVTSAFLRWSRTPEFSEGTRIPVLVDPAHAKRAIPLALYGDPSPVSW